MATNSNGKRIPPPASEAVLAVTASITINAPRDKVWKILTGFEAYGEWNPFVRAQSVVDASTRPLPDSSLAPGLLVNMSVHLPPTMGEPKLFGRASSLERILVVDREECTLAWEACATGVLWLLSTHAERWQSLTDMGDGKTRYDTYAFMSGPGAYLVRWLHQGNLNEGFQAMAEALKARVEAA